MASTNLSVATVVKEAMNLELNCPCGGTIVFAQTYAVRNLRGKNMTCVDIDGECTSPSCRWDGLLMTADARDGDTEWNFDYDPEGIHFSGITA